jgi:hypothetical protein
MAETLEVAYQNPVFNDEMNNERIHTSDKHIVNETRIEMGDQDSSRSQISVEGVQKTDVLRQRITVTFHNVTKVINVPAKMIDPSSKERFIQRTLLDNVSGQILPEQIVALMGPSGILIVYLFVVFVSYLFL